MEPKSGFPTFETGTYEVNSLKFFTRDDGGNPYYKARPDGSFFSNYNTYMDEEQGPPGSAAPEDLPLLVYAFGGDPGQLPVLYHADGTPNIEALFMAESLIQNAAQATDVYAFKREDAKSAWIQRVNSAVLPVGKYLFRPAGITSRRDGDAVWYEGRWGTHARVQLTVECNADASPSPFRFSPVTIYMKKSDLTLYQALFPSVMSELGTLDKIETALLQADHFIYGEVAATEVSRGSRKVIVPKLDKESLRAVPRTQVRQVAVAKPAVAPKSGMALQWHLLKQAIDEGAGGGAFLPGLDTLTDAGKAWCRANLKPISQAQNLPAKFAELTDGNIKSYLIALGRADLFGVSTPTQEEDEEGEWD